jgi:hypothetical protein
MRLAGYYIGIDGSSSSTDDPALRSRVHSMVRALARAILKDGGGIVTLVSGDPRTNAEDPDTALTFIWTLLEEIDAYADTQPVRGPLCRAVLSPRTPSERIPSRRQEMWTRLLDRGAVDLKYVDEKKHLGVYLRMEQAERGDALVIVGGGKGVQNIVDLYRQDGRPVVPLDANLRGISNDGPGAAALNAEALRNPELFVPFAPARLSSELPLLSFREGGESPERIAVRLTRLLSDVLDGREPRRPLSLSKLLRELHQVAIEGGLGSQREPLLSGMNAGFKASLPQGDSPAATLLMDLSEMFQTPRLTDGSQPLLEWLQNAIILLSGRPQAEFMKGAYARLTSTSGSPFSRR